LKILFVYEDERAKYLIEELKDNFPLIDILKIKIDLKKPYVWKNFTICFLEIISIMIRTGKISKLNARRLYYNAIRRPAFIQKLSSLVEKYVNSHTAKPDLILQWQGIFAPYTVVPKIPYALIIDNYTDPPNSPIQKDKLRGWSTFYDRSFFDFQKELYENAERIFTLSKWCKEGLSKEYGIDPLKVTAIGWGPAKDIVEPESFEKQERTILAIGNDYESKGIDILLETAKYLSDFRITIVGEDRAFKAAFSIPKNVQIEKHLSNDDLVSQYLKSEFFFIFSKFDPSPHVLWEAQASGCVVIGFDAYGISEAITNKKTGLLLKTRKASSIAEEIRKLKLNDVLMKQIQKATVQNYEKNGTWTKACMKLAENLTLNSE
jgi:glycosyltransferase involved in cell wall biosynthesis